MPIGTGVTCEKSSLNVDGGAPDGCGEENIKDQFGMKNAKILSYRLHIYTQFHTP